MEMDVDFQWTGGLPLDARVKKGGAFSLSLAGAYLEKVWYAETSDVGVGEDSGGGGGRLPADEAQPQEGRHGGGAPSLSQIPGNLTHQNSGKRL